jgi:hypothetical protein
MRLPKPVILVALLYPVALLGAPLTEAHVTKIINTVKLIDPAAGERSAKLDDVVRDEIAVTTGIKSRSELLFQDNTLTRLGPDSYFSFKGRTREMTLQKGTLLLQVPKSLGGAQIHTASVTAAITGTTIMMEYLPGKDIKVLVLEGSLRLAMNGKFGDSLLLTPGKMVMMNPNAKRIPDPVTVDLKKLVQTSTLVNMGSSNTRRNTPPLPSMALIDQEIDRQQIGKDAHTLQVTNFSIDGKGTNGLLSSDNILSLLATRNDAAANPASTQPGPISSGSGSPAPLPPIPAPSPTPHPIHPR